MRHAHGIRDGGGRSERRPQVADEYRLLRHEAVPGFVDRSGAAVGMAAMVMPFALEPGTAPPGGAKQLPFLLPCYKLARLTPPPAGTFPWIFEGVENVAS